jgi:dTDP-N-acetylfucosamine:lipid II N-acetylfucosaminyltransferase
MPMKRATVLHIVEFEKFIPPFIDLVRQQLSPGRHEFFFIHGGEKYATVSGQIDVTRLSDFPSRMRGLIHLSARMHAADKIVLHGLTHSRLIIPLYLQRWLLPKAYWVIWGKDLYTYKNPVRTWSWKLKEFFRRPVIRSMGHLVTYVPGDVELARQWYGATGRLAHCILYPSNQFNELALAPVPHEGVNVLIGNSADRSNHHAEILQALLPWRDHGIHITAPLSYGDARHADEVTDLGRQMFGAQFTALRDFMPYADYLRLLSTVDIAVFNHDRQQGMGNIISLLGLGKTVYMRPGTTSWAALTALGAQVRTIDNFDLALMSEAEVATNRRVIREHFSRERLVQQLRNILEG